jgi:TorA maturation chaperone TorD
MSHAFSTTAESTDLDLAARSAAYVVFARLFREAPTPGFLQWLKEHGVLVDVDGAPGTSDAEAIAIEYARLFAVPGEQSVQPYESVYRDTLTIDASTACSAYFSPEPPPSGLPGFLYGPSAVAVRDVYARAGFEVDPATHQLPDHLSVELEFLGHLLQRGDLEDATAFFRTHLGRWVFRCMEEITQKTPSGFYGVVAEALSVFLAGCGNLNDTPSQQT